MGHTPGSVYAQGATSVTFFHALLATANDFAMCVGPPRRISVCATIDQSTKFDHALLATAQNSVCATIGQSTKFDHALLAIASGGQSYSYKVTPLCNQLFFKVTSNGFVTFKIAVTSHCNGTVTFKSG